MHFWYVSPLVLGIPCFSSCSNMFCIDQPPQPKQKHKSLHVFFSIKLNTFSIGINTQKFVLPFCVN